MAVSHTLLGIVEADELIDVPIESEPSLYQPIDARIVLYANSLASFLPGLQAGLIASEATLADGRRVESAGDAVCWCVEAMALATGS